MCYSFLSYLGEQRSLHEQCSLDFVHHPQQSNVHPKGFTAVRDCQVKGMSLFGSTDSKDSEELWFPSFGQKRHSVPVLRRTTTVYGKPTAPGHWTPLHLPSLPSQNSKAVSEGRQEQTKQQPLTFSSCPKHHFPLNLCYFHLQKQHHTTCHLPDFRNPSSASGEAETSEASEEDRTTTSGKSEDPPGT